MEYKANTKKLSKQLTEDRTRDKTFGKVVSTRIKYRLQEFKKAKSLDEISTKKPARLHQLSGDYSDCFAVDVSKNFRLIFVGFDENLNQSTDKSEISFLLFLDVEDYH